MKKIRERSLRLESLEDRMLLAVTAGCEEAAAAGYAAPAETGAEIVVNTLTMNALRNAIRDANDGDTITFSVSGTISVTSAITIGKNITIDGGGYIILQGAGDRPLFNITSSCSFTGLELAGGATTDSSGNGGVGRVNEGVTVTLNDCSIHDNSALEGNNDSGGAFYVSGTLNMNNCSVYSNKAAYGGFAYISGRGTHATVNAVNCNFYGNSADDGAVIYNQGGTLNLTSCSVAGNTSQQGAIFDVNWLHSDLGSDGVWYTVLEICDTTVTDSIFACNYSPDQAVADFCEDYATVLVHGGAYTWETYRKDDTFTKFECANSIIGLAGDYFAEAPVFDEDGNLTNLETIDLSIRSDSIAAWAGIGANPADYTGAGYDASSLVVTTLEDAADANDGVVSLREALAYATLGTFDETPTITFADGLAGGVIALSGGQLAVISDVNIAGDNITVDAGGESRVLYLKSYNYQYDIPGNYASIGTGEYEDEVPVHDSVSSNIDVSIDGVNITGGTVDIRSKFTGGAGILALQNVSLSLSNLTVSDNVLRVSGDTYNYDGQEAMNGGGGLAAILYSNVSLDNVKITDNTLIQVGDHSTDMMLLGGGVFVGKRSSLTADNTVVSGNEITSEYYLNSGKTEWGYGKGWGGGICAYFANPGGALNLTNSEVSGNTIVGGGVQQFGGGIYYYGLYDTQFLNAGLDYTLVVTSSVISGNSVGDHRVENNGFCQGAGLFTSGAALLVNDLIAENTIDAGSHSISLTGDLGGAGIYNRSLYDYRARYYNIPRLDIYYSTITNNTLACVDVSDSSDWGGGIQSLGSSTQTSDGTPCAATVNLVGSIQFHNYIRNSSTGATSNSDSHNGSDSALNMSSTLYNQSGIKGSGYTYTDCIKYLARYKVFTDEANGDYTPWSGTNPSQALDALSGNAPAPPEAYVSAYDVRNEPYVRVYGSAQDLGCYETQPEPSPTFQVTITDYTGDYDGQAHTVSLSGLEEGDTVLYSADGETYSEEVISYTDPGTYTVYVRVARGGYQDYSGSGTVTINAAGPAVQLETPVILTGKNIYVSYGANRHQLQWSEVGNASGYEVAYTDGGTAWNLVSVEEGTSAVISGLTYGLDVDYKVRALGDGTSYADSDWSAVKTFNVCPMDINNDEDISGGDRTLLAASWLAEEDDDNYRPYADINGDGDVGGADRAYLSNNWLGEAGDDDLQYPPAKAANAFFAEFASADLDADLGIF